jgi:hypothetical protein
MVNVIYLDGTVNSVSKAELDVLIATGRIKFFLRGGDWVDVENKRSRLRDYHKNSDYQGPERRAPWSDRKNRPQR